MLRIPLSRRHGRCASNVRSSSNWENATGESTWTPSAVEYMPLIIIQAWTFRPLQMVLRPQGFNAGFFRRVPANTSITEQIGRCRFWRTRQEMQLRPPSLLLSVCRSNPPTRRSGRTCLRGCRGARPCWPTAAPRQSRTATFTELGFRLRRSTRRPCCCLAD